MLTLATEANGNATVDGAPAAASPSCEAQCGGAIAAPKTVLMILVDQLANKWLELCYDGVVDLPNLAKLRDSSLNFTRAYSVNPVCSPTRATLLTGLAPSVHGLSECGYNLDPRVHTMPRQLQAAGWQTVHVGKLHVRVQIEGVHPDYKQYGFDRTAVTEDARAGEWIDWVKETHPEHYRAALSTVWMHFIPELSAYGPEKEDLASQIRDAYKEFPESTTESYVLPFPKEVSQTEWITGRALEFLEESDPQRDLFLQVSYVQPHNPFSPPAEYLDRVRTELIPEPAPAEWESERLPYFDQPIYEQPSYATGDWMKDRHHYLADLAHLDDQIGVLMEALKKAGRNENCLIIFTSDHGELLHDHGMLGKWERHYDACARIPLYVCAPGATPENTAALASHLDVVPTIYEFAGVDAPTHEVWQREEPFPTMPTLTGHDLLDPQRPVEPVLIESNNNHWQPTPSSWSRTLMTDRYRFTHFFNKGGEQLFDLVNDPDEQHNLAADPAYAEIVAQLRFELFERSVQEFYPGTNLNLYQVSSW